MSDCHWLGDLALQILNVECVHARLPSVQVGEVLLTLDELQLPPHEDTAQEPDHGVQQAKAAGPPGNRLGQHNSSKTLVMRGGNGGSPQSLEENMGWFDGLGEEP